MGLGTVEAGVCSCIRMIHAACEPLHSVFPTSAAAGKPILPQVLRALPSAAAAGGHSTASSSTACEFLTWSPLNQPSARLVAIDKQDPGRLQVLQAVMTYVEPRSADSRSLDGRPAPGLCKT